MTMMFYARSATMKVTPAWVLLVAVGLVLIPRAFHAAMTTADEARRFGVAESLLSKPSKAGWRVECMETSDDFFERYRDLDEVYQYMKEDLKRKFEKRSATKSIGTTAQNRPILSLRIGPSSASKIVLAMAGLHGREWTSVAALLYAVSELSLTDLPEDTALVVIPITNPDGYVKTFDGGTHTKERYKQSVGVETDVDQPNRYWRKNGVGVDLNRNFGHAWGNDTKKSNKLLQSDVYQGKSAYSEKETQALRDWAEIHIDQLVGIIDFHCCIGAVLAPPIPPGTSSFSIAENENVGKRVVEGLSEGGKGVTRTVKGGDGVPGAYEWRPRSPKDVGAGLSSSWGFVELIVDLTFVVEMRGKFVAPCWEIRQLGKEALYGLKALLTEVETRPARTLKERKELRYGQETGGLRGGNRQGWQQSYEDLGSWAVIILFFSVLAIVYLLLLKTNPTMISSWQTKLLGLVGKGDSKRTSGKE